MKDKDKNIKSKIWDSYNLEKTLAKFVFDEPFYAYISEITEKRKDNSISTAGVTIENSKYVLLYNEDFFNSLPWQQKQGVLIHEFLHIIFEHLSLRQKLCNNQLDLKWCFAVDFAVNSFIEEHKLPDFVLMPGKYPDIDDTKYPPEYLEKLKKFRNMIVKWSKGKSADWYYEQLKNNQELFDDIYNNQNKIEGSLDSHQGWGQYSSEEKDILNEKIKHVVNEAFESCNKKNKWGSVSYKLRKMIKAFYSNQVNWLSMIDMFIGSNINYDCLSTYKKINRKYPYLFPAKKSNKKAKIAVCVDYSGSITNKEITFFISELMSLSQIINFTFVPFDTKVLEEHVKDISSSNDLSNIRIAQGGTNFDKVTEWINQNSCNYDACIFMTDGGAPKPRISYVPRAWIITTGNRLHFETHDVVIYM